MNHSRFFFRPLVTLASLALPALLWAQPAARPTGGVVNDGGGNRFGLASPVVGSDRMVTFRVSAPEADTVVLTSDFAEETPLTKDAEGVWSVTVGPVAPDLYYYNFVVNGVRTIDPGNSHAKVGYYTSTMNSILIVPEDHGPAFYDVQDVPHGEIRTLIYKSQSNGVVRELNVYVPPGYDENPGHRYPVLYLLHGNANDHHSWQRYGRANEILDNLLAAGSIEPFIVVMPLGYGRAFIDGDGTGNAHESGPDNRALAPGQGGPGGPDYYEMDIIQDVVPMIDGKFRTIADRRSRAIFGFSMGGGQSGRIGLGNLDVFSSVGIMSAGFRNFAESDIGKALAADPAAANAKLDLLWVGCGTDDFAFAGASAASQAFTEMGIQHTFVASEGAHHWRVWRRYLRDIAPQLFKP